MASCTPEYPARVDVPSLSVPGDELCRVFLIAGPDFDCVNVKVWSSLILMGGVGLGRRSPALVTAPGRLAKVRRCVCAADRLCIFSDV